MQFSRNVSEAKKANFKYSVVPVSKQEVQTGAYGNKYIDECKVHYL